MKFTGQEEYGLRCVLQVARHSGQEPLTIAEIAGKEGLSVPYVAKLMALVRRGGLVTGVRGRRGGYVLARDASEIFLDEVLAVLGEQIYVDDFCEKWTGELGACKHKTDCAIRSLWRGLEQLIADATGRISLADLAQNEEEVTGVLKTQWAGQEPPSLIKIN